MEERGAGDLADVAERAHAKLVRRHPHVFPESEAVDLLAEQRPGASPGPGHHAAQPPDAASVLANWDRIKRELEGRGADDVFADVPENLPGLLYARKVLRRMDPSGGRAEPLRAGERDAAERRVGESLIATVELARELGVDPELAVRAAAQCRRDSHRGRGPG